MLILTRRCGEKIMVGDNICITILDTDRAKVRIGIDAPHDVPVHREEIYRRIQMEKAAEPST